METKRWIPEGKAKKGLPLSYALVSRFLVHIEANMQILPQRKQCHEVTGGRRTYQVAYATPGLFMQIYSRHCDNRMNGGGEVHFLSSCASGRITRIMLADIVGSAEIFMGLACEMRKNLIRSINSVWQTRVVDDVTEQFRHFAGEGGCGTASVVTYFAPKRNLVMCNIGNPPPLVYRSKTRTWQAMLGQLDVQPNDDAESIEGVFGVQEYRHFDTQLNLGDIVVIYGNGFAQSTFPDGSLVSHQRLIDALQDSPNICPLVRLEHLIGLVQPSQKPSGEPDADSTVIACKVTRSPVRLRDNLLAPFRWFKGATDATVLM